MGTKYRTDETNNRGGRKMKLKRFIKLNGIDKIIELKKVNQINLSNDT